MREGVRGKRILAAVFLLGAQDPRAPRSHPGEKLVLQDVDAVRGKVTRTCWEVEEEGPPRWIIEEADTPRGPWSRRVEVSLDQPGEPVRARE